MDAICMLAGAVLIVLSDGPFWNPHPINMSMFLIGVGVFAFGLFRLKRPRI